MWQIAMAFVGIVSGLFVTNHSDNSTLHYSSVIGLLISTICLIQAWPWIYVLTQGGYGDPWRLGCMFMYMVVLVGITIAVFVLFIVYKDYILLGFWCGYIIILVVGVGIQISVHRHNTKTKSAQI
jgi:hypothetical protein